MSPYPTPINDPRLSPDLKRTRNGHMQEFSNGQTEFQIEPPERHIYADLIDGVWHWVNGCAECRGEPRSWTTYIECDKHNVCQDCGCSRDSLDEPPWSHAEGWICKPCMTIRENVEKEEALSQCEPVTNSWELYSNDHARCPYCGYKHEPSYDTFGNDAYEPDHVFEHTCWVCDNTFAVETIVSFTYTTAKTMEDLWAPSSNYETPTGINISTSGSKPLTITA